MSSFIGNLHHPITKQPEKIWESFSWPMFFLGFIWYIYRGMYKWSILSLIVAIITSGIGWVVFPFINNKQYIKHLLEKGFLPDTTTKTSLVQRGLVTESCPTINEQDSEAKAGGTDG